MSNNSIRPSLVLGKRTRAEIANDIYAPLEKSPLWWKILFGISLLLLGGGGYCVARTWWDGIGMWGENRTINWAWDITNFVWWIGIGHAGTFISAILLLFRQDWRNPINRAAEAMTLCAVTCSAFYIFIHLGRVWVSYWVFPFPDPNLGVWPNFNSQLVWDAFAIATYLTVSLVYWYAGTIPDFAELRDRTTGIKRKIYAYLCWGWDGSAYMWRRYQSMMQTLAGLATALVVSVHSIIGMDFAGAILPGWHSTIFPPYFVAGAILSGFAMVVVLVAGIRVVYKLENYITPVHFDFMNQMIIINSGLVGIAYGTELFAAWYERPSPESYLMSYKLYGEYAGLYWLTLICNVGIPLLLWFKKIRRSILWSIIISLFIQLGMWVERFVIIVTSLARDFLPTSWAYFSPTLYDIGVFIFSVGLFLMLFLLFLKFIPSVNVSEMKEIVKEPY